MITLLIEWIKAALQLDGGTSVWQILWEIPDAEVRLRPPGQHREGIPLRYILGHRTALPIERHAAPSVGRHRMAMA